ncbi:copper chaperone PCu(A)C [Tepidiforma sp.]|uniref:copper chaperone PCu(A)C n=1 Tax=Tepidiforma sp. TaxID=2682230 RepID=UPI002ADD8D83|nr:copper chaperone PCu(A)C [Tepidiforma sp.]
MNTLLRHRTFVPLLLIGALALALLAAACGGDDDDNGSGMASPTAGEAFTPVKLGSLTISDAWVRASTGTDVTAAYLTVKNSGAADTLVAASSPIAGMVQLHEVITEGATSKMQEKPGGFPVPANGTLQLVPGGYHIMLMNLKSQPKAGETVQVELTFEKAGKVTITAPVKVASGKTPDMDHNHGSGMASPTAGY